MLIRWAEMTDAKCKVCGFSAASESATRYAPAPQIKLLLESNFPPSDFQESNLREAVVEGNLCLQDLKSRIEKMRQDLEGLVREREEKEKEMTNYKDILHPIRRLPREILSEIFLSFINEELEEDESKSSLDPLSTQWIIPRVSRHWRSVALSLSRMWSTIRLNDEDFDIINLDDSGRQRTLLMLGVQLCRSGSYQLSISISSGLDTASSHPLLQLLFPTSCRWKDLLLLVPVTFLPALGPIRGSLSSLHTLHIWPHNFTEHSPIDQDIIAFEFAPNLTTLVGNPYIFLRIVLPYAQITAYECKIGWTCSAYASLLSFLSNLQRLEVDCSSNDPLDARHGITNTQKLVNLPRLYSAILDATLHSSADCSLLRRLSLPALTRLDIAVSESVAELRAMLQRSRCSLVILELAVNDIPDDTSIVELLDETPTLISLKVDSVEGFATKLVDDLIKNPSILPSLQALELGDSEEHFSFALDMADISQLKALRPSLLFLEIDGERH
ncbi:hypothetical protein C8J56DRAFT_585988 [Mycena floridula]|nr:hypothetical protein C8J56DRAFT_585988 [Mycena floridula]